MKSAFPFLALVPLLVLPFPGQAAQAGGNAAGAASGSTPGTDGKAEGLEKGSTGTAPVPPPVTPPTLLKYVEAEYPAEAKAAGLQGAVLLQIDIDEHGKVGPITLLQPAGHGFDEAAIQAVRQFEFAPATSEGKPLAVRVQYRYNFVLRTVPVQGSSDPASQGGASTQDLPGGEGAAQPDGSSQSSSGEAEARPAAGPENLIGRVLEAGSRDPLEDASISLAGTDFSTSTDEDGKFSFRGVPNGDVTVKISFPNYDPLITTVNIAAGKQTVTTWYLRHKPDRPYAMEVRTKREQEEVAQHTIQMEEVRRIPGTYGDAIRVIQNLPGVARDPFGLGFLVIRGTGPNDSGTYIDGMRIPLIFHFGGLVSVFNSSLLDRVDYLPGGYSVRYGRSIGGVVDVATKDDIPERTHGYAEVDLFNSSFFVQGSIGTKIGYSVSARRSYIDYLANPLIERLADTLVQFPRYWDTQLRLDYKPSSQDAFQVMFFANDDRFAYLGSSAGADESSAQQATFASYITAIKGKAKWTHTFSDKLSNRLDLLAGPDERNVQIGSGVISFPTPSLYLRDEVLYAPRDYLKLRGGIDLLAYKPTFDINIPQDPDTPQVPAIVLNESGWGISPAPYAEAEFKIAETLKVVPGLRFDPLYILDQYWNYSLDPRLSFRWKASENSVIKGNIGRYSQPPQPQQLFKDIGTPELSFEHAVQGSLGFEYDFTKLIHLDAVAYYASLYDQVVTGPGGGFGRVFLVASGRTPPEDSGPAYTNDGLGRNYGLEVLLRHDFTEKFFGWVSYTLSRAERKSSEEDEEWRLFNLDQTHILTVVASYQLPRRWEISGRFRYTTGLAYTPVLNSYQDMDRHRYIFVYGDVDSARNPAFISLDARVQKDWTFQKWKLQAYLDVQNVTNRANPEATFYSYDGKDLRIVTGLPILPILGLRGDF